VALGNHILLECYGCDAELLKNEIKMEQILTDAAKNAHASVLHTYFHKFEQGEGITGIIALAESHISVHTWPEHNYMAIDVFMCGDCNPLDSISYINQKVLMTHSIQREIVRGVEFTSTYK